MNLEGKIIGYNKKTVAIVVYTLVIIGIAFFVGAKYEKSKLSGMGLLKDGNTTATAAAPAKKAKTQTASNNTSSQPADSVSGSILSKDSKSLTIKTANNISQLIAVPATTTIGQGGTLADLTVGEQVDVKGVKNSDGSFTAQDIQKAAATNRQQQ